MASNVIIEPVCTKKELRDFVMFPYRVYRNDPNWVAPLISDRMKHFDPQENPFFEHAAIQLFRARRDGQTVGTIAAIDDEAHKATWNEPVGFFGAFEVLHDYEAAAALFDAARTWLAARGIETMRGPFDLNVNDEIGLLVEGRDGPPVVMMTYCPAYYQEFIEAYGMTKAKDVLAFKIQLSQFGPNGEGLPERVSRTARVATERYRVTMRKIDFAHLDRELEQIRMIYRAAWAKNWGAVPVTDAEFDHLANGLKQIADRDLSYLAFIDDQPVGVFVALPDYCQPLHHMNGRMLPFGWISFLRYRRKIDGFRVLIMGVLEEHRLKGVEALFYKAACEAAVRKGYKWTELSWILEDNYKMIRGIEAMGGEVYRRYRIYDVPTKEQHAS
ncbi:MAG: N-acetyltransferase [Anaerolineales bacterium]